MATGVLVALCLLPLALGCALPPSECPHQQWGGQMQMGAMQVGMQGAQNYQNMANLGSALSAGVASASQNVAVGGAGQGQWWSAQSQKDMEDYQRWCREKEAKQAALQQSMQILTHMKQQKAAQDAYEQQVHAQMQGTSMSTSSSGSASTGVSVAVASVQRQQAAMQAQFKQWQTLFSQQQMYKAMMTKFTSMSEQYTYCLTLELLKFCQSADIMSAVARYSGNNNYTLDLSPGADASMFQLSELEGVDTTNAVAVASRIYTYDSVLQTRIFFGGLVKSMCDGAKNYVARVRTWEAQYLR